MKWMILLLTLLYVLPSPWAFPSGAPPGACSDLMPDHGVDGAPNNTGFFLLSEVIDSGTYIPGEMYSVTLVGLIDEFAGFFIQARTENNSDLLSSIVGTWAPSVPSTEAATVPCNGADSAITHATSTRFERQEFIWTAPAEDRGRIHFVYSVVIAFRNIIVKLNATEERPPSTVDPPPEPTADTIYFNSYGRPEGCQRDQCEFYIEWRTNENFIDFRMEGDATGWIALGITSLVRTSAGMNTTSFIIGNFSDILLCQAEPSGSSIVNVKDMFYNQLRQELMFDSNDNDDDGSIQNGVEFPDGVITDGRISCNFSRVQLLLVGQEEQDFNLAQENNLFFLSGNMRGEVDDVPADFDFVNNIVIFNSTVIDLNRGFVPFIGMPDDLPGEGSFPTSSCSREDCDFYFRWGVNPNNPNYLTFFISADLSRGWAAVGVSRDRRMGGDEIDDIFGCTTVDGETPDRSVSFIDTLNVAGGDRQNVGDFTDQGIIGHSFGIVNGRLECTFSRIIPVLPGEEDSDFNLDASYYIIIGTGESPGTPFTRHERNPEWSTSEVNLVRETSVDFDYARIPLIRTHGILMVFAWPVLAWLGIGMARHMKPALPNGGWFLLHRILVITSLVFTCISFALIFIAFRNTEYRGLISLGDVNTTGTVHFVFGIIVVALQLSNPIIALFRCHPGDDNRWIFNIVHGVLVGAGAEILSGVNILIGLYLFGDKVANPQDFDAFWVMIGVVVLFAIVDFSLYVYFLLSRYFCEDKTKPEEIEMKQHGSAGGDSPPMPKKAPSEDHWIRWIGWITLAAIVMIGGLVILILVAIR